MAGTDVLEQQGSPPLMSHRARRAALVVVLLLAASLAVVDWQVRRHEAAAVDRCLSSAVSAVAGAEGPMSFIARYVSPSLASSPPEDLRRGLLDMISSAAAPGTPLVRRARDLCQEVSVLPTHTELRRTRADCLRLLRSELAHLAAVAEDGARTFVSSPMPRGRCQVR